MSMYSGGILRVVIDDVKTGNHKRFRTSSVMGFEYLTLDAQNFTVLEQNDQRIIIETQSSIKLNYFREKSARNSTQKYIINFKPFKIECYLDDMLILKVNNNQLFNFEYERTVKEHFQLFNKVPYDATYKYQFEINEKNQFTEMFDGYVDINTFGPRSIGIDFEFNQDHLFGIPEHAIDFLLKDTLFTAEDENPYRLYNIDVFPYKLNSTQALYGSIPYLLSHSANHEEGNAGVYWSNAAETWVDLMTPNLPFSPFENQESLKRVATFNSESGVLEFIVILGHNPAEVTQQWADVSGHAPIPPYWSLGYHQSKWSYESASEVVQVNFKFDQHSLPLDVIWLDIDHTSNFEYFTWNTDKFSNQSLEIMNELIEQRKRKIVVISDPHIRKNDSYFLYDAIKKIEKDDYQLDQEKRTLSPASGKYFLRDPKFQDRPFEGRCWPGNSVWLDFMQLKVRQFWAALYQYDVQPKTNKNYFVWNDMNEPSVLDKPELALPKDVIFGAVWTGDNGNFHEDMKISVQMLLSMSVAGLGFVGADIGGFANQTVARVIVQWHNLAVFYPFMRQHCHKEAKRREPYLYKGEAFNQLQKSLRLRQKLMPYMPMMMEFPDVNNSAYYNEQYMFGEIFLVKPDDKDYTELPKQNIINNNTYRTQMFFPKGTWYDFFTSTRHQVNFTGLYEVPQESGDYIYVFAKGGTILPMKEKVRLSSMLSRNESYLLNIYLETNEAGQQYAQGFIYLDDGETFDYLKKDEFKVIKFDYLDGTLNGAVVENGGYFRDYERIKAIQIFGLDSERLNGVDEHAVISKLEEDQWKHMRTIYLEKLPEHEMIVIMNPQIDLMDKAWRVEIKQRVINQ
ncbi:neutral alpha-glucosidase c [Stylonychia lemnae]|uniref:Glucosidase II subunit alpha n=1 Tax=Stylonychia lemnae TaxID=5949 RepID=A0A078AM26_STYLE|nr:neutral alpha-glucosidase c [Stylonychia lemnae]|eukprot:CDW82926.1 neutral alpha-glucosidase c [Stylonychia lemnae]